MLFAIVYITDVEYVSDVTPYCIHQLCCVSVRCLKVYICLDSTWRFHPYACFDTSYCINKCVIKNIHVDYTNKLSLIIKTIITISTQNVKQYNIVKTQIILIIKYQKLN